MNIKDIAIKYDDGPINIELCSVRHMNPHFHQTSIEFIYCLRGSVSLFTSFQKFTINENQICSIDSRDIHCLESDDDNLILFCHIDISNLDTHFDFLQYVFFACESFNSYPYQKDSLKWLERTFISLAYLKYGSDKKITPDLDRTANQIISVMLRYFNYYTYLNVDGYFNDAMYERFQRILAYCHKNYNKKINISQIALKENINKNYMSQFLRKSNVKNFNSLLKFIRCYETEHLLLTSDISIAEASYECGFSDPKYFYPCFREWFGCTPKEHRNWYREFMKHETEICYPERDESFAFLEKHITERFLNDTVIRKKQPENHDITQTVLKS